MLCLSFLYFIPLKSLHTLLRPGHTTYLNQSNRKVMINTICHFFLKMTFLMYIEAAVFNRQPVHTPWWGPTVSGTKPDPHWQILFVVRVRFKHVLYFESHVLLCLLSDKNKKKIYVTYGLEAKGPNEKTLIIVPPIGCHVCLFFASALVSFFSYYVKIFSVVPTVLATVWIFPTEKKKKH